MRHFQEIRFFRGRFALLVGVWLVLGAYVLFPALETLSTSVLGDSGLTLKRFGDFFSVEYPRNGSFWSSWDWLNGSHYLSQGLQALYGSLVVSIFSAVLAGFLGITLAFLFEKREFPGRSIFSALMFLPLTLPPVVGVVSFDLLFSESGILPRGIAYLCGLSSPPFYLSGKGGIIAVHGYAFFPFFYLLVGEAIRRMDSSLLEASRGMGYGVWRTFLKVEWPMLTPALFGGAVMVFMLSMASFSAPLLFDVDGMYLSTHIYNLKNQNLLPEAYTATVVFALASLGMLLLLQKLRGNKKYQSVGKGVPRIRPVIGIKPIRYLTTLAAFTILVVVLLPHLTILLWSFTRDGTWTYQILPPEYTVENYVHLLGVGSRSSTVFEPVRNSLWMAGAATFANLLIGIAAAYVLKSRGIPGKAFTEFLVMLPWALPGTVIAINLIVTFGHPTPLALGFDLANSIWLLPIAYSIRNIPLVVRPLAASWEHCGEDIEEAARSLGAGRLRTLGTISLPLAMPALVSGTLLAFVTALGEFVASAILYTPSNRPISMAIFAEFHSGAYGTCSAYGVLLIGLIAAVMILGRKSLESAGM